jgi:cytidylate kinase
MKNIKIAIDGHSSCGKSTLAKDLAKYFGYVYIDTGAMYRAVTLYAMKNGFIVDSLPNLDALRNHIHEITVDFRKSDDGTRHTTLNGEDVEKEIRRLEVSKNVSLIAAIGFVRSEMVTLQRKMAQNASVVMDGRDIGTVVFPDAELKLFVTAHDEVRAQRRFDELRAKGDNVSYDEILENLRKRDLIDSTRAESPLRKADDAIVLDNSELSLVEQFEVAKKMVEKALQSI